MKTQWPIIPTQISENDKEISKDKLKNKQTPNRNEVGLLDNFELQGFISQMSAEFMSPCTIFEFTQKTSNPIFRTDSASSKWDLPQTCQIIKQELKNVDIQNSCTNHKYENFCYTIDNIHVQFFKETSQINPQNIESILSKKINSVDYISKIENLAGTNTSNIKLHKINELAFLEYNCPFLGYTKTLFPLFVNNKYLVGLLLIGEFLIESERNEYERKRSQFFKYLRKKNLIDTNLSIEKQINETFLNESFITKNQYENTIVQIANRVDVLQERLGIELERKRMNFINEKFARYNNKVLQLNFKEIEKTYDFTIFWEKLKPIFNRLIKDFPVERFNIFCHKDFQLKYSNELSLVFGYPGPKHDDRTKYSLNKIKTSGKPQVISSIENISLFNGLDSNKTSFNPTNDFIQLFPVNPNINIYFLIYVRYTDKWNQIEEQQSNKDVSLTFKNAFESFLNIISVKFTTTHANCSSKLNNDTLKIYGHEMAQFFSGIDSIYQFYLKCSDDKERIMFNDSKPLLLKLPLHKVYDISKHLDSYLTQIIATNRRSKYLIEIPPLELSSFWPYDNLIYKWYNTNKNQLYKEKKNIIIVPPRISDITRPKIIADKKLLQHVFYNIVMNAIKYSYWGTNIFVDGQLDKANEYVFKIVSYGIGIPDNIDIYSLYSQSEDAKNTGNAGLGIGLYISKNIIQAHKGLITHSSKLLSNFNIPLMWALNVNSEKINIENKNEIIKELRDLTLKIPLDKIVNCDEKGVSVYEPSTNEILNEIFHPTYENIFKVSIPQ